jgi:hypothetical protein
MADVDWLYYLIGTLLSGEFAEWAGPISRHRRKIGSKRVWPPHRAVPAMCF